MIQATLFLVFSPPGRIGLLNPPTSDRRTCASVWSAASPARWQSGSDESVGQRAS